MISLPITRAINRRALFAFTFVLATLVIVTAGVVVELQRENLRSAVQAALRTDLVLLGELATDALLQSNYAAVQRLLERWSGRRSDFTAISAVMPNGFVLAEIHSDRAVKSPLEVDYEVVFGERVLLTLRAVSDFAYRESEFVSILVNATVVSVVLIMIFGWMLWWTLKRTAIEPLEKQILAREEKEKELTQRTAQLESAIEEIESFNYSVSHDLRTPLRAIAGFSQALLEDYGAILDADGRGCLERVRTATQRMGLLIDGLLRLSQVGRTELKVTEVDLSGLARDILTRIAQVDPGRQVDTYVADNLRATGDAQLLAIAFENLLGNAWKYTAKTPQARIEFSASHQDGEVVYSVCDNGAGFDMRYASSKLFRPFQRMHSTVDFPGTGIGLATVARIIKSHHGRTWAHAIVDQGATIYFTLKLG